MRVRIGQPPTPHSDRRRRGGGIHIAVVTAYPPSRATLTEYGYHFVQTLRTKPGVAAVTLLVDADATGAACAGDDDTFPRQAPLDIRPCWRTGAWDTPLRILSAVRRPRPDVVVFNLQFATFGPRKMAALVGLATPALVRACGVPTVVLLHNLMNAVDLPRVGLTSSPLAACLTQRAGTFATRLLLRADRVTVTLPRYARILEEAYGATNVLHIPHGSFAPALSVPIVATTPTSGPVQILVFGKFGTYKRVETAIEAVRLLRETSSHAIELVIAGADSPRAPGYLARVRRAYADEPGLRFAGYVPEDEVARLFGQATVVALPYEATTGSSGVLHLAGTYGKAVVLPHLDDLDALVADDGYAGEFFAPGDAHSLAAALARVLDDPAHRQALEARNAVAARRHPLDAVVDTHLRHIHALLAERDAATHAREIQPAPAQPAVR